MLSIVWQYGFSVVIIVEGVMHINNNKFLILFHGLLGPQNVHGVDTSLYPIHEFPIDLIFSVCMGFILTHYLKHAIWEKVSYHVSYPHWYHSRLRIYIDEASHHRHTIIHLYQGRVLQTDLHSGIVFPYICDWINVVNYIDLNMAVVHSMWPRTPKHLSIHTIN